MKQVGDFNKKESESLDFNDLMILRDYLREREDKKNGKGTVEL